MFIRPSTQFEGLSTKFILHKSETLGISDVRAKVPDSEGKEYEYITLELVLVFYITVP